MDVRSPLTFPARTAEDRATPPPASGGFVVTQSTHARHRGRRHVRDRGGVRRRRDLDPGRQRHDRGDLGDRVPVGFALLVHDQERLRLHPPARRDVRPQARSHGPRAQRHRVPGGRQRRPRGRRGGAGVPLHRRRQHVERQPRRRRPRLEEGHHVRRLHAAAAARRRLLRALRRQCPRLAVRRGLAARPLHGRRVHGRRRRHVGRRQLAGQRTRRPRHQRHLQGRPGLRGRLLRRLLQPGEPRRRLHRGRVVQRGLPHRGQPRRRRRGARPATRATRATRSATSPATRRTRAGCGPSPPRTTASP